MIGERIKRLWAWINERSIGQRLAERFGTFETIQGLYFVAMGVALLWKPQLMLSVGGLLLVIEGVRRLVVNRVKERVRIEALAKRRREREHMAELRRRGW